MIFTSETRDFVLIIKNKMSITVYMYIDLLYHDPLNSASEFIWNKFWMTNIYIPPGCVACIATEATTWLGFGAKISSISFSE